MVLDEALGEPPAALHPVARLGSAMTALEQWSWADSRPRGVGFAMIGGGLGAAAGAAVPLWAIGATSIAGRMLVDAGREIATALEQGDLAGARVLLPTLVGRDPAGLEQTEIARAVVESLAENLVDAVVAPVLWGLALGGPAVGMHRAVNTLDAMVGHRTARHLQFGWFSARLDDVAAWLPARVTALVVVMLRPYRAAAVARAVWLQAPHHPSPNGGVAEGAFAAALGISLGGVNTYDGRCEDRGKLGEGPLPQATDIRRAAQLFDEVRLALVAMLVGGALVGARRARRRLS